jgi:hypothetical protein
MPGMAGRRAGRNNGLIHDLNHMIYEAIQPATFSIVPDPLILMSGKAKEKDSGSFRPVNPRS